MNRMRRLIGNLLLGTGGGLAVNTFSLLAFQAKPGMAWVRELMEFVLAATFFLGILMIMRDAVEGRSRR